MIYENSPIYPLKALQLGSSDVHVTQIDISNAPYLEVLSVTNAELALLDLSYNTALIELYFSRNNLPINLDLSHNTVLNYLDCSYNQLTGLDISHNTALNFLQCNDNRLSSLDISNNTLLTDLLCRNNSIPLAELYKIAQRVQNLPAQSLGVQTLPDTTVLADVSIPIDTVFYGINSAFAVSPSSPANYTLNNGEITFLNAGVYQIEISNPAIPTARVRQRFTVTRPATGASMNKPTLGLFVKDTEQLVAAVAPNDANQNVTWSSDNPDVASVSDNGTVMAKAAGTATITATTEDGGFTATCAVTVSTQPTTGISLNKSTLNLVVENSEQLTATIAPVNATNQNVTWSSSDSNIASVSNSGMVTAKAAGTTTITATTEDGSFIATCDVTVKIEYSISVVSGTASAEKAIFGTTVAITANTPSAGKAFDKWTSGDGIEFTDANAATTTFVMPEKAVTITATYKNINYTISVTGGSADKATAIMGEEVALTLDAAPMGKEFDRWNVTEGGVTITNNRFTMGTANVVIEALWKNINYTISVTGGSADKATAIMGEEVTLTIATPPTGKEFDRWNVTEGGVTITNNKFTVGAANVVIEAVYNIGTESGNVTSVTIYPNPATDFIHVSEVAEGSEYSIVNSSGQIVLVSTYNGEAISIAHLLPGQYVVQIAGRAIKMVKL